MVSVRHAKPGDIDEVQALLDATWHATYDTLYGAERVADITSRWHSRDALLTGLETDGACFLVAEEQGTIGGTVFASCDSRGTVHLLRLYVHPHHQRAGIGGALLERVLAAFPKADSIRLEVEPANAKALAFYEAKGFKVAGRSSDCCGEGDNIPAMVMERAL